MDTSTLVKEKWTEILDYLKKEFSITDVSYRTWLLPLSPYDVSEHIITITVDDNKVGKEGLEFVKNKQGLFLKTAIEEVLSTKEEYELFDALSRENGEAMSPIEELVLLGYYEYSKVNFINYDEEYDFDENDERYRLLEKVLRLNNDRRKYFA